MKKCICLLSILFMFLTCNVEAANDGETSKAYTNNFKFYNKLDGGYVLKTGKPAMVLNPVKGVTTYTVDLYTPGFNSYVIITADGGKTISIEYFHSSEEGSPSAKDVYDKIQRPWDKEAQERGKFNTIRERIFYLDTSGGRKSKAPNYDYSRASNTPAIIGVWKNNHLYFYIGDGDSDGGPVASVECFGIYNRVTTMSLNSVGPRELDWLAFITLCGDINGI